MLQNHLLIQLHKYITLSLSDDGGETATWLPDPRRPDFDELYPTRELAEEARDHGAAWAAAAAATAGEGGGGGGKYPPIATCAEEEMVV